MNYLEQVIDETLRIYPAAGRLQRFTSKDYEFNGMEIEKGTTIWASIYGLHFDTGYLFYTKNLILVYAIYTMFFDVFIYLFCFYTPHAAEEKLIYLLFKKKNQKSILIKKKF